MNMNMFAQLKILLHKELIILRNTYFRNWKTIFSTILVGALIAGVITAVTIGVVRWLGPTLQELPQLLYQDMSVHIFSVIFLWGSVIFFFSTIQESRNGFFRTPDLSFLVSTPFSPLAIFSMRFIIFTFFYPVNLFQLGIFMFAPLFALGYLAGAPWFYYPLLVPVSFLYLSIPSVIGITIFMFLIRFFSPRRLFQISGLFSISMIGLWVGITRGGESVLNWIMSLDNFVDVARNILLPLRSIVNIAAYLIGVGEFFLFPFAVLLLSSAALFTCCMLIIRKLYYQGYEMLRIAEKPTAKINPSSGIRGRSVLEILLFGQWKNVLRNYEMGQAALGFAALFVAYIIIGGRYIPESPLLMLINIGIISFVVNLVVTMLFMPPAMLNDRSVISSQYWLFKIAPVSDKTITLSLILGQGLPVLILGLILFIVSNIVMGIQVDQWTGLMGAAVFISTTTLFQMSTILDYSSFAEELPLATKILRESAYILYPFLVLLPLAAGFYYTHVGFLGFLHSLPERTMLVSGAMITLLLAALVSFWSFKYTLRLWSKIEI